ncbi:DUF6262 family protein [Streptomyces sp. NBC_00984]|uniref:DUF6262 family protein n=1 Tax=Streptomyces sp. NBC_00984 TaxID=2903700 RepID=UPI0038703CE1|nr:DUF6262 family protein [Streptomyces sp. NBC_00984]
MAGESLLARRGFWSNYLLAMCSDGACAERPAPEWFGDDGADADAMSEVLFDPERWPAFRVPAEEGPGAVVIYRNLVKRSEPITFQAVQREAGVSHAFLYSHPDLRGRIERLRAQARLAPAPASPADEQSTLVLALTGQITRLKKRHREEVQALRDALEQAHGENLDLRREVAVRRAGSAAGRPGSCPGEVES